MQIVQTPAMRARFRSSQVNGPAWIREKAPMGAVPEDHFPVSDEQQPESSDGVTAQREPIPCVWCSGFGLRVSGFVGFEVRVSGLG